VPFWITYYGGSDGERANASSISPNNTLYLTGLIGIYVNPASDFPLEDLDGNDLNDAYFQCDFGGNSDVYIGGIITRFKLSAFNPTNQPNSEDLCALLLQPNPASDKVFLQCDQNLSEYTLQIFDITGSCKLQLLGGTLGTSGQVDVNNLENGIYFLRLFSQQSGQFVTSKLIIQRP
jgi:hypothetical protein